MAWESLVPWHKRETFSSFLYLPPLPWQVRTQGRACGICPQPTPEAGSPATLVDTWAEGCGQRGGKCCPFPVLALTDATHPHTPIRWLLAVPRGQRRHQGPLSSRLGPLGPLDTVNFDLVISSETWYLYWNESHTSSLRGGRAGLGAGLTLPPKSE